MGAVIAKYVFLPPESTYDKHMQNLVWITERLPAVYFETIPYGDEVPYTVLFSHGNAEDLGCIAPMMKIIRDYCNVNVLAYEYEGYGLHAGSPSEAAVYRDVRLAWDYLVKEKRTPPSKIILFGRSLGSGPSVHLAAELFSPSSPMSPPQPQNASWLAALASCDCRPPVNRLEAPGGLDYDHTRCPGGVVLQSPLTSVVGVVSNMAATVIPDMFMNLSKIDRVKGPVLVLHGTEDTIVPFDHGKQLSERAPNLYQLVDVQGAGHNDIEENFTQEYLNALVNFVESLEAAEKRRLVPR